MVAAVSMCRDEADIVRGWVQRMARQVDLIIVADNGSLDGTREILDELAGHYPLEVIDDPEVAYIQSAKMSRLAAAAAAKGASWVIPADMDEVWVSTTGERVGDLLNDVDAAIASALLYDHVPSAQDGTGEPMDIIRWRRPAASPLPKVACRPALPVTIAMGNHAAAYPDTGEHHGQLVVHHFPWRTPDQMVRKVRNGAEALRAAGVGPSDGAHWQQYAQILEADGPDALGDVFREWFWSLDPVADGLIEDPCE